MDSHAYQLLSLGARYLFVFGIFMIVLRAGLILLSEHRRRKKRLRSLPDAGMVGEMCDIDSGKSYPLPREGVLGSGRGCDIRIRGLKRRHANFAFVDGKGLLITPCHHRSTLLLDGQSIRKGGYALHGAIMQAGEYQLRIRLFAGLKVPRKAQYAENWQPAYDEDLYAPEEVFFTPVQPEYIPYPVEPAPCAQSPELSEDDVYPQTNAYAPPVYYAPVMPENDLPADDEPPLPFDNSQFTPEEEAYLPSERPRRRRSERNKHL